MSFVLFEIIIPAEEEDLQNDIEDRQKSGGSDSDTDGEDDTDASKEEDAKEDEEIEWNTSEEESKIEETEDSNKKDVNSVKQADEKQINTGDHSHEPIDITGNQQPKETELNLGQKIFSDANNPLNEQPTYDKKKTEAAENCSSGEKGAGHHQQSDMAEKQENQKQKEKDKTNSEKIVSDEVKSEEQPHQNEPVVKKTSDGKETLKEQPNQSKPDPEKTSDRQNIGNDKNESIKQSERRSKRKKKRDRFSVKPVKDGSKSNVLLKSTNNKNDGKNDKSNPVNEEEESDKTTKTDSLQGKNKLGRKVQFESIRQKSSKKSGDTKEENSGNNSTENSGFNSIDSSGDHSGNMSDENSGYSTDRSRNTPKYEHQFSMVEFIPEHHSTLLESVKETISYLDIKNSVIVMTENQLSYKVSFVEESGSRCEIILKFLKSCGAGRKDKSSISVIPVSIYYDIDTDTKNNEELKDNSSGEDVVKDDEFKKSVKARLVVDQVVQSVKTNAALTFDYLVLTFLASLIAAVGLIESSSVVLVASMLISPLMGPILAIVFGSVIKNPTLWKLGLKNELIGLGVCISCGFVFGLLPAGLTMIGTKWRITDEFPTIEMSSRGTPRSLGVGILIAIPSGAGVALSVLGGNMGSLVGVAISASLLPPAVNAGMLWAYSIMTAISPPTIILTASLGNLTDDLCDHFEFLDNTYQPNFFCDMWKEAAMLGFISLVLTVLNIAAILLMGCLVLRVKEVVPLKEKDTFTEFFHNDIKIARKSYQTHKNYESRALFERFVANRQNLKTVTKDDENQDKNTLFPNSVKMINRQKLQNIAAEKGVQDITQRINRPISLNYNLSEKSLKSLESQETKGEVSTKSGPNRKFEVITYPDEISNKDKQKQQNTTDNKDPAIKNELIELNTLIEKKNSTDIEENLKPNLERDQSAERDDNIEVEEQCQMKLAVADLFDNPHDDCSQNPLTLKNSKDTGDTNKSDCDNKFDSQQAQCDTDSEGEMSQPLINLKV